VTIISTETVDLDASWKMLDFEAGSEFFLIVFGGLLTFPAGFLDPAFGCV
jgi:hypothetical protein